MATQRVMERLPLTYIAALVVIGGLALLFALTWLGWVPIDSLYFFLFSNTLATITVMAVATLGGAFVGLLLAHRILGTREFSPFERALMETLHEVRGAAEQLQRTEKELMARLDDIEEQLRD